MYKIKITKRWAAKGSLDCPIGGEYFATLYPCADDKKAFFAVLLVDKNIKIPHGCFEIIASGLSEDSPTHIKIPMTTDPTGDHRTETIDVLEWLFTQPSIFEEWQLISNKINPRNAAKQLYDIYLNKQRQ